MKNLKKKLLSAALILGSLAAFSGCVSRGGSEVDGEATVANAKTNITLNQVAVETIVLDPSDHYEQVYVAGQLEAEDEYNVLPYTAGVVKEIMVNVGDEVHVGDVLYKLDSSDLETNRDNTIDASKRSKDQAYNSLILAQKDLTSSSMSLTTAQKNYEDNLKLFESGFVTQSAMDSYEDALDNAKLAYDRSVISLDISQSSYDASVATYDNNVVDFANSLDDMTVTSPIDGRVTRIDVQVDVTNNMNTGVTVVGSDKVIVSGSVIEKYINDVVSGQQSTVSIKAVGKTYEGEVTSVSSSSSTSYYPVEVTLDNDKGDLKAGMFAGVTINTNLVEDIITVPKTSVLGTGATKYVFVDLEGVASKRIVTTGRDFGQVIEVSEGLASGDQLVIEGQIYLEEGTPLIVNNEVGMK